MTRGFSYDDVPWAKYALMYGAELVLALHTLVLQRLPGLRQRLS